MSIFDKIFGSSNQRYLDNIQYLVDETNLLESKFKAFSDEELKKETLNLKEKLKKGKILDDILPEAFALVREAAKRTLNQRHFDVQLIGGIVLHQGRIAEMKTGEGKTLTSTLALYLNALEEKGVHLITVNDYLTKRDVVWMGQIYHALGLSVGCIVHDAAYVYDPDYQSENSKLQISNNKQIQNFNDQNSKQDKERDIKGGFKVIESYLRPVSRKEAYATDITYGTNNEFGFDYLRDNMVYPVRSEASNGAYHDLPVVQRSHSFAIIDEIDSILIDEARTPLIISAPDMESSDWYQDFSKITPRLQRDADYSVDEKMRAVTLTEEGINKVEKILQLDNIYEEKGIKYLHYLEAALKAEILFKRDKDYVVKDGQIIIVDQFTGRLMPGRRFSGGLHQALEAKEGAMVQPESKTLASITFQNYFRLYEKLAGMTGTAITSAEEFDKVYKLEVITVPTNKPMIRKDLTDRIYKTEAGKFKAVIREIKERNEKNQPVLVGTTSIDKNEYLGKLLEREGIQHQILNAKHHEREGEIIAQAGRVGAVTIATNMAGRGVDIILGGNPPDSEQAKKVAEFGGIHIIGTERHEARRIDNQLRGRSGRQGNPGSSQFFVSLEDDLLRIFGGDKIKSLMGFLKIPEDEAIETKLVSGVIESAQSKIEGFNFDARKHLLDYDDVLNKHRGIIYKKRREFLEMKEVDWEIKIKSWLKNKNEEMAFDEKKKELQDNFEQVVKFVALKTFDALWMEHLDSMEYLRDSVRLRAYGQRDPLVEYKNEGHKMFQNLLIQIETDIVQTILKTKLTERPSVATGVIEKHGLPVGTQKAKVGRNDPCLCGSGKKYKKCCGK